MNEVIIDVKKLSVRSGNTFLLNEVSWQVHRGEHWLVFGMNGSGKTTLLSIVAGFNAATSGTLSVFGMPYASENVFALRQRIGWVSASFFDKCYHREQALDIVLSGLFGSLGVDFGVQDEEVRRAKRLLSYLGMADKMHKSIDMLSKGERQSVFIARALIAQPEILVLDEPGTGLDVYARARMMAIVRDLTEQSGVTTVYVTHYLEEFQPFMKKTLLLRGGRVYAQGDTTEVLTAENLSALVGEQVSLSHETDCLWHMTLPSLGKEDVL
ncbi:MAG: ATP-binding cassette domain-containing protein [Peptococcaceae bacterium]|nr:ATP-binding cassette domain-containing protein [Peptococcaceae bacterium]